MSKIARQKSQEQDAVLRNKNFEEVCFGYTEEEAVLEATRCLQCKVPKCKAGCPVGIDIPEFIKKIVERDFAAAYQIIKNKNALPGITGRVCPQETQCEGECIVGLKGEPVAIGNLERFIADWGRAHEQAVKTNQGLRKVAVFGSGPAGLACAGECAKLGFAVTVFEALHELGGVLRYGIPRFRLPNEILDYELDYLRSLGVKFEVNVFVGFTVTMADLKERGFEAFFVSTGAGVPYFLNIPNENLKGVYTANEFLTRINWMQAHRPEFDTPLNIGKKAIVVGGGNVAMDAARTLLRIGFENVSVIYRRTKQEMPARRTEIFHAEEEGIDFKFLRLPIEFIGDEAGNLQGLKIQEMQLTEQLDARGRKIAEPIKDAFEIIKIDTAVIALGQSSNPILAERLGVALNKRKNIIVDENMQTSVSGIFAGGDITTGASTVISAMGAGKLAAYGIKNFLTRRKL